jgi:hypothetical protein
MKHMNNLSSAHLLLRRGFGRFNPPKNALFKLKPEDFQNNGKQLTPHPTSKVIAEIANRLWGQDDSPRFALLYNAIPILLEAGFTFENAVKHIRTYRNNLYNAVYDILNNLYSDVINPFRISYEPNEFEAEGYNINRNFLRGEEGEAIDFYTTKQLHFDIVEPLSSNLYGPNENIKGGLPAFADGWAYCERYNVRVNDVLEKIPGSRILTFQREHYKTLLEEFTIVFDIDMTTDTPFSIFLNRVEEACLLHGATSASIIDPAKSAKRPLSHYALDNLTNEASEQWYRTLGKDPGRIEGNPSAPKPLIPHGIYLEEQPPVLQVNS